MVALAMPRLTIQRLTGTALQSRLPALRSYVQRDERVPLSRDPGWLGVLENGFGHTPFAIEATEGDRTIGYLPLSLVKSLLFGRFLVSLPYLNSNGVIADTPAVEERIIDSAIELADELRVRHMELRQERPAENPNLATPLLHKVHMRLELPRTVEELSKSIGAKVRNQIRKGEKNGFEVKWGGAELIPAFHEVFSRNMRDLGTPVYGQRLMYSIQKEYSGLAEFCVVSNSREPVAVALLLHGKSVTEVPNASSLKEYNSACANMLLYWQLLQRAIERGQQVFDFGRSTPDGNTFRFKKQWGAKPETAVWQHYVRSGHSCEMRPDNPKYDRLIRIWKKLPVRVTRWIGPTIARGIP